MLRGWHGLLSERFINNKLVNTFNTIYAIQNIQNNVYRQAEYNTCIAAFHNTCFMYHNIGTYVVTSFSVISGFKPLLF